MDAATLPTAATLRRSRREIGPEDLLLHELLIADHLILYASKIEAVDIAFGKYGRRAKQNFTAVNDLQFSEAACL